MRDDRKPTEECGDCRFARSGSAWSGAGKPRLGDDLADVVFEALDHAVRPGVAGWQRAETCELVAKALSQTQSVRAGK